MELTSVKTAIKERIEEIDNFISNLPELKISLDYNQRLNSRYIDEEWIKWENLQGELSRILLASKWLQSKIKEAISVLGNNLEIEINQKNMLRKSLEILENRTKPLEELKLPIQNFVYYCQSKSKEVR